MSQRNYNVDRLRILATFGIVWFHTVGIPGRHVAYAGLAIFIMLSFAYVTLRSPMATSAAILSERFKRLLLPWAFWWLIYLAAKMGKSVLSNTPFSADIDLGWILAGPSIHLWYLPFAFVMTMIVSGLNKTMIG